MDRDRLMRRALWATAVMNAGGMLMFAFPESLGRIAGLPSPVPRVYALMVAALVGLFGATYAWLAVQPRIHRPLVAFAAFGKSIAFAVFLVCWLLGDLPGRAVLTMTADLGFATFFAWWLLDASSGR